MPEKFIEKIRELGIKIPALARILNLSKENLYKWQKGHRPSNYEDNIKLENFTKGLFDQFVKNGKLTEGYQYENAIAIIFPRNPTNDSYENAINYDSRKLSLQEPNADFSNSLIANALNTIMIKDKEIAELKNQLSACLAEKSKLNFCQKTA